MIKNGGVWAPVFIFKFSLDFADVLGLKAAFTLSNDKFDFIPLFEVTVARASDARIVHENIFFLPIGLNKPVAFGAVEPLHNTGHCILRHTVVLFFLLTRAKTKNVKQRLDNSIIIFGNGAIGQQGVNAAKIKLL